MTTTVIACLGPGVTIVERVLELFDSENEVVGVQTSKLRPACFGQFRHRFGLFLPGAQPIGVHVLAGSPDGGHKQLAAA